MKILIVDDSNITRIILKKALKASLSEDTIFEEAFDGDEAIEKIDENYYDFIYLDLNMPKVPGITVLKHIKEKNSEAKIVVCSVNNDYAIRREVEVFGIFAYIAKPFTSEKIKKIMQDYIV